MDEFFKNWFNGFNEKYFYDHGAFLQAGFPLFFNRLHEVNGVDGEVIETGKVYDIIFLECACDLHTKANVNSCRLCECSRQSIICEMRELVPTKEYKVEKVESVLSGDQRCRFRISEKA